MSFPSPQRLPLAPQYRAEWQAGRALAGVEAAPRLGLRLRSMTARLARLATPKWRVIPGGMGLPSLIVPVVGEIIP